MTWSGPNLLAGTTSVLTLHNINRNQTGNYQCTASNDVSSNTSVVVNVVVECKYSQTCLSLRITTSFVSRPYVFLRSVFLCIRPLYNDPLSNAINDRVLCVNILHITTIRRLLSNQKLDNQ